MTRDALILSLIVITSVSSSALADDVAKPEADPPRPIVRAIAADQTKISSKRVSISQGEKFTVEGSFPLAEGVKPGFVVVYAKRVMADGSEIIYQSGSGESVLNAAGRAAYHVTLRPVKRPGEYEISVLHIAEKGKIVARAKIRVTAPEREHKPE